MANKSLGIKIQALLHDANESTKNFGRRSKLNERDLANVFKGQFAPQYIAKLMKGVGDLRGELAKQQSRIEVAWVSVGSVEGRKLAEKARKALEKLLDAVKASNEAGSREGIVSEAQRAQLTALLKAMIAELEGNYVDRGRVKSASRWFTRILARGATAVGVEILATSVVTAMSASLEALGEIGAWLADKPGLDVPDEPIET
jgi:hypothetical protein